ncbi:hypothetical protein D6B99_01360 [Arachidicoccus soli]|uniref:Uncharacterized protein n=1 Tax=Arachidicoccus soli TaxID=2341117 RepID=A0A386HLK8_9BACT|nr:hypothetical protein D6B99_01360 [Arachidicoccus soli]
MKYTKCVVKHKKLFTEKIKKAQILWHLLKKKLKLRNGYERSRIEKGIPNDLERHLTITKNKNQ